MIYLLSAGFALMQICRNARSVVGEEAVMLVAKSRGRSVDRTSLDDKMRRGWI